MSTREDGLNAAATAARSYGISKAAFVASHDVVEETADYWNVYYRTPLSTGVVSVGKESLTPTHLAVWEPLVERRRWAVGIGVIVTFASLIAVTTVRSGEWYRTWATEERVAFAVPFVLGVLCWILISQLLLRSRAQTRGIIIAAVALLVAACALQTWIRYSDAPNLSNARRRLTRNDYAGAYATAFEAHARGAPLDEAAAIAAPARLAMMSNANDLDTVVSWADKKWLQAFDKEQVGALVTNAATNARNLALQRSDSEALARIAASTSAVLPQLSHSAAADASILRAQRCIDANNYVCSASQYLSAKTSGADGDQLASILRATTEGLQHDIRARLAEARALPMNQARRNMLDGVVALLNAQKQLGVPVSANLEHVQAEVAAVELRIKAQATKEAHRPTHR